MPIMNGYEACEQIVKMYENQNNIFRLKKEENGNIDGLLDEIFTQPLMIAISGFVDDEIRLKAKNCGFQVVIESPITVPKI